ncbi:MAG: serine/threonine protein kinase [Tyzzerella sp.]|nr:serine/threonine protein kinase [Tyzzerella sp.]
MGLAEEYKISVYQDYGPLATKEHIRLVRNKQTGQICVKKVIDYTQRDVIEFRRKSTNSYFPQLFDVIEENGKYIIIEEYVNGVTLEEYMMGEALSEEKAVKIGRQVCKALIDLHHAEPMIVYRDLKAENIMVTSNDDVKLVDFNISRTFQEGKKRDTVLLGTAEYAAPEQFGYFQTDNRTDIYAFGVLFNYMLTGKFPIEYITEGKYADLVQKCIELEPSKRYQEIEKILEELGGDESDKKEISTVSDVSWTIPGFRSKTGWKMITATLGYLLVLYMGLSMEFVKENGEVYPLVLLWIYRLSITAAQIATIFFVCNYRGISNIIPIYKHRFLIIRVISYIATWFVFFLMAIMVAGIIETIINI